MSDLPTFPISLEGDALDLGAIELESDQPLQVVSEIFTGTAGRAESWRTVEVARHWLVGQSMIPRAIPSVGSLRLYLSNPNEWPITISYKAESGQGGSTIVEAHSARYLDLDSALFGYGSPTIEPTGSAAPLHLESVFEYMAAAVAISSNTPPDVHVAQQLPWGTP